MKGHKEVRLVNMYRRRTSKRLFANMRDANKHSGSRISDTECIRIFHEYTSTKTKGYWDDFSFTHRGLYYNCAWIHPRKKYTDLIEEKASEMASLMTTLSHGLSKRKKNDGAVSFKKLGRSRKKATLFSIDGIFGSDSNWDQWIKDCNRFTEELISSETPLVQCIENEISIEIQHYGLFVNMVLNKEIVDEQSIRSTVHEMRKSIDEKGYAGLYSWVKTYPTYSKEDILSEISEANNKSSHIMI